MNWQARPTSEPTICEHDLLSLSVASSVNLRQQTPHHVEEMVSIKIFHKDCNTWLSFLHLLKLLALTIYMGIVKNSSPQRESVSITELKRIMNTNKLPILKTWVFTRKIITRGNISWFLEGQLTDQWRSYHILKKTTSMRGLVQITEHTIDEVWVSPSVHIQVPAYPLPISVKTVRLP